MYWTQPNASSTGLLAAFAVFHSPNSGICDIFDADNPSHLDFYGDVPPPDPDNEVTGVEIPPVVLYLAEEVFLSMQQKFNALTDDNNFGINVYLQVRGFLHQIEQSRQDNE